MEQFEDRWLTMAEITEYLSLGRDTVMTWVKENGMPAARIGKVWRFKRSDVDEWMKNYKNPSEE